MKTHNRGQSIIEYILVSILIIFGIIYMGPYVLRSINAYFNLWNDGLQDSFNEHLTQAPPSSIPPINSTCQCTPISSGTCGGYPGSHCSATQEEIDYNCNPQGCNGINYSCPTDNSCCSAIVDLGCGNIPIGQVAPSGNCNYGYHVQSQTCGSTTAYQCIADSSCNAKCQGNDSNANYCPNSDVNLVKNTVLDFVGNDSSSCTESPPGPKCQVYCNPPYVVNSTVPPSGCVKNCVAPAEVWSDDYVRIYQSDANGDKGALVLDDYKSDPLLGCKKGGSNWSGKINDPNCQLTLAAGYNYFLVDVYNESEQVAVSLSQENSNGTPETCLTQVPYPGHPQLYCNENGGLLEESLVPTGCWINPADRAPGQCHTGNWGNNNTWYNGLLFYIYIPPGTAQSNC